MSTDDGSLFFGDKCWRLKANSFFYQGQTVTYEKAWSRVAVELVVYCDRNSEIAIHQVPFDQWLSILKDFVNKDPSYINSFTINYSMTVV